ncbi:MAG: bifunctional transaldolase/phosoglucose isomerase [Chloroflexota bacterium]|nr:MAG: bifunctional transaldolase/phosoglucose isomerase [Chloroflexota bacterium]
MIGKLLEVNQLGQSIWYDHIRRAMLNNGELAELITAGIRGVTSNPTIFAKAIAGSADYDPALNKLAAQGVRLDEIYESLVLDDIAAAADLLDPIYKETNGLDGYVSVEVRPTLANDTEGTIREARHLFKTLDRPNVMIKVPATAPGIPAIKTLIAEGINVNVTLIFSVQHYETVAEAYFAGLEQRLASGGEIRGVISVASIFVSRVDTLVDRELDRIGNSSLKGKIAIANAKAIYQRFKEIFSGERWERLSAAGARLQRPLWASTGTKNPHFPDTLYVDSLIGPDTVNTLPPATLSAFRQRGQVNRSLDTDMDLAENQLRELKVQGIDLFAITQELQEDGVTAFINSHNSLMDSLSNKMEKLASGWEFFICNLGEHQKTVDAALEKMRSEKVISRIWEHDHTVWKPVATEISNRLGWLHIAESSQETLPLLTGLTASLQEEGYDQALLLGMGGSSLAAEVFHQTFGVKGDFLSLDVLDSTDPGAVRGTAEKLDLKKTLIIVSTKSGGTVETLSFFKYFYNQVLEAVGEEKAGGHFIAITDAGSQLDQIANRYKFRAIFKNDPNIGGRFSALSYFGLVPAALIGLDLDILLERATTMSCNHEGCNTPPSGDNHAARLGAILGELAKAGIDKLTLITSPAISSFGDWVEQLIAESTGKEGQGILPVVGEAIAKPDRYFSDRLFVYLKLANDTTFDDQVTALERSGHPVVRMQLADLYDLGGQFFLWEMATAVAGHLLGINPFNQPNVESAKVLAREMVKTYQETGELPVQKPALKVDGIAVYGEPRFAEAMPRSLREFLDSILQEGIPGGYIALQAYLQPTQATDQALQTLRTQIRNQTRLATTLGYGPRFLHSTGQLHKGDSGAGFFVQLTSEPSKDIPIPDEAGSDSSSITFGVLEQAQALGDRQALLDGGRKVIRLHLGSDSQLGLNKLIRTGS